MSRKITDRLIGEGLEKRLLGYSVAAGAVFVSTQAMGAIQYFDIADVVLENDGEFWVVDIDGGGANEFRIQFSSLSNSSSSFWNKAYGTVAAGAGPSTLAALDGTSSYGGARAFSHSVDVSDNPSWGGTSFLLASYWRMTATTGANGQFLDQNDKYIGVTFLDDVTSAQRYGWIHVIIPANAGSVTITGYAYEDEDGVGIGAGHTAVPEPGTMAGLGLLALGAAGMRRLRRKRTDDQG